MPIALCLLAVARIGLFGAAFPPFSNMDEDSHVDLVLKYSHASPPRGLEPLAPESAELVSRYATPEYFFKPDASHAEVPAPIWRSPPADTEPIVRERIRKTVRLINHECTEQPLYYALAGGWCNIGKVLGLRGAGLLYWLRFLNALLFAPLIWLAHATCRRWFPGDPLFGFGVPLLLAVFPQDVFYAVNNDTPSALLFGLAFVALVDLARAPAKSSTLAHAGVGLLVTSALLTKLSNAAIVGLLLVAAVRLWRSESPRRRTALTALVGAAALPAGLWMARNLSVLGELSGGTTKARALDWTPKAIDKIWDHPIFSPAGCAFFIGELARTFWRGELVWHGERMAFPAIDAIYVATTVLLVAAAVSGLILRRGRREDGSFVASMSLFAVGLSVLFMIGVSLAFDFGGSPYPSRQMPFMTSGRLISGALLPFAIIYVSGLKLALAKLRLSRLGVWFLLAIAGIALVSEIVLTWPVFGSQYNLFHML